MKINEISLKDISFKYGSVDNLIALCQTGAKSMRDVIFFKELLISKINYEIEQNNFLMPNICDMGILFYKKSLEVSIFVSLTKNELPEDLHNIFYNEEDLKNFMITFCNEHNNTSSKMKIFLPYYKSDYYKKNNDSLVLRLLLNIY